MRAPSFERDALVTQAQAMLPLRSLVSTRDWDARKMGRDTRLSDGNQTSDADQRERSSEEVQEEVRRRDLRQRVPMVSLHSRCFTATSTRKGPPVFLKTPEHKIRIGIQEVILGQT